MPDPGRPVDRAGKHEILRFVRHFHELRHDPAGCAKAGMHIQPRAGAAVFGQVKIGCVEPFGHVPALVDAQKEERHPLRAFALQGCGPVAGLFETDPEPRGDVVQIVFRRPRLGQKRRIGHQHGGGEIVRQFHPQPGNPAGVGNARPVDQPIQQRAVFQQAAHVRQLEGAVGMVQRLGQPDLAPRLVILA